jgi:hypothetical protein
MCLLILSPKIYVSLSPSYLFASFWFQTKYNKNKTDKLLKLTLALSYSIYSSKFMVFGNPKSKSINVDLKHTAQVF